MHNERAAGTGRRVGRTADAPRIAYATIGPTARTSPLGATTAVLLLHGVGSSSATWKTLLPLLPDELTYLTPDLRGHGSSDAPAGPYSIDDFVDDQARLLDDLGIHRSHVVGFSLGAVIAQALALAHPERIASMVLLNSTAGRTDEERQRSLARLELVRTQYPRDLALASVERWFTTEFAARNPGAVAAEVDIVAATDPAAYAAAYEVLATVDLLEHTRHITCPALVVTGEFDSGSTPRMSALLHANLPRSEYVLFGGLRHYLHIEAAPALAELVGGFLRQHAGPLSST